jgi:hypothetical protein
MISASCTILGKLQLLFLGSRNPLFAQTLGLVGRSHFGLRVPGGLRGLAFVQTGLLLAQEGRAHSVGDIAASFAQDVDQNSPQRDRVDLGEQLSSRLGIAGIE